MIAKLALAAIVAPSFVAVPAAAEDMRDHTIAILSITIIPWCDT